MKNKKPQIGRKYWIRYDYPFEEYALKECTVLNTNTNTCSIRFQNGNIKPCVDINWLQENPEILKKKYKRIMKYYRKQGNKHKNVLVLDDTHYLFKDKGISKYIVKLYEYDCYMINGLNTLIVYFDNHGNIHKINKNWLIK